MITFCTPKIVIKKIYFFFSPSIRMSGINVNFGDKRIKASDFYKNKTATKIDDNDVNKILKNHIIQKFHSNTLSDTMVMMLLGH